jgi:dihydroorotate dehydrogenase
MEDLIPIRNSLNSAVYDNIIKPICFMNDPESTHNLFINIGKLLGSNTLTKDLTSLLFNYQNSRLQQNILGISFRNPIGLSAGFDKNAELISIMGDVGFGFVEVGSVTALQCNGNEGRRVARIIDRNSLWVNFGLNNNGTKEIAARLAGKRFDIPYGVSVAKTNCRETVDPKVGTRDYLAGLKETRNVGSYHTINISCPNAYGGQPFSNPELYEMLMKEVDKLRLKKPVFVKLSPDLGRRHIDMLLAISKKHRINGFVCTNLTKRHGFGRGGLSGKPVEKMANELIRYVHSKMGSRYVIIGVGGVFSAEDAYKKIRLGASLVELITGMIYRGPGLIGEINYGLVKLLDMDGYNNISEAVGSANKI